MADDIVNDFQRETELMNKAADEIKQLRADKAQLLAEVERLRVALALACNELFGTCDPLTTSPRELMQHFMQEARRD